MNKFTVGDRIKLNNYEQYDDHLVHQGEVARVISRADDAGDYKILWSDGETSFIFDDDNLSGAYLVRNEGGAQMARKTYKLVKDTPTLRRGAIFQEACDDGTQEYILLSSDFDKETGSRPAIFNRSLVEDQPKWFVEVFQVEPQYMTAAELEQWEAFKAQKLTGKKTSRPLTEHPFITGKSPANKWTPARRKAHGEKIKAAKAAKEAA